MKKNKKLVINIALIEEDQGLASRLEADKGLRSLREEKERSNSSERLRDVVQRVCSKADQNLGSLREEKDKSNSSERLRDVVERVCSKADQNLGSSREEKDRFRLEIPKDVFQRLCSKARGIDGSVDDPSSFRDGMMREIDVGTGLSGALNRLREQGTFKGECKLVVGVKDNHEGDRFSDGFKDIQIQRVDKWGRILTQKEAYRALCHGFHGKQPGKKKQTKRKKKQEDKSKQMESSERAVERMRQVHAVLKRPYIVL